MDQRSESNRRAGARRSVRYTCEAVRERDFTLLGRVVLDLSATGLLLRTSGRALTGDAVIVSFFEPTVGQWFDVQATVSRVIHGRREGDVERCLALKFESMTRDEQVVLEDALAARVPMLPKKRIVLEGAAAH